jgi:hypothetical protein
MTIPAPHVLPSDSLVSRIQTQPDALQDSVTDARSRVWAERLEEEGTFRKTLGAFGTKTRCLLEEQDPSSTQRLRATQELPPLPARRAYPQTFQERLLLARPKHWPQWWDEDFDPESEDEVSSLESPASRSASRAKPKIEATSSCPDLHGPGGRHERRRTTFFDGDPESLLSPFALKARKYGADVVLTGQKLPVPIPQFEITMPGPLDGFLDMLTPRSESKASGRASSTSAAPKVRSLSQGALRAKRQPQSTGRPAKCYRRGGSQVSSVSWQSSNAPLALLQGAKAPPLQRDPSKPKLPKGPAGLWDKSTKLLAVREVLDGYAADPLVMRPGSSAGFLERYVERQVEIERLLRERQGGESTWGAELS